MGWMNMDAPTMRNWEDCELREACGPYLSLIDWLMREAPLQRSQFKTWQSEGMVTTGGAGGMRLRKMWDALSRQ